LRMSGPLESGFIIRGMRMGSLLGGVVVTVVGVEEPVLLRICTKTAFLFPALVAVEVEGEARVDSREELCLERRSILIPRPVDTNWVLGSTAFPSAVGCWAFSCTAAVGVDDALGELATLVTETCWERPR
jgi:hypothetical protein